MSGRKYTKTTGSERARISALSRGKACGLALEQLEQRVLLTGLPAGWTDTDIGSPSHAGSAAFNSATGAWTNTGGGSDIWNNADQFNFASETFSGNGRAIAQVTAIGNTDEWAKGGVMFRNDTSAGSAFADMVVTPGQGVSFQWRSSANGDPGDAQAPGPTAPAFVELVRNGNNFSGYYSTDGVTWNQVGSTVNVSMNNTALAGLAVTAHNDSTTTTAGFSQVSITANAAPTVATAASASPNSIAGTSTSLSVLGADDLGEGNLTYSWATTGNVPAAVGFSANGTNLSKNTTASFTASGNYQFLVTITDQSGLTTTSTVGVSVAIPPPAPTGIYAAWSPTGGVQITWSTDSSAQTYRLYRASTPGGEGMTALVSNLTGTSYLDSTATSGQTYYYEVTAVNSVGTQSAPSFEALTATPPISTQPIISEFEALNNNGITDETGEHSDWIELYNPSSTAINLSGYYLTDKTDNLTEWKIPAVSLPADGFLVVFADSENLTDPTKTLHTNFGLSGSGEYLALVAPDGATVLSSYNFPQQLSDLSYGIGFTQAPSPSGVVTTYGAQGFLNPTPGAVNGQALAQSLAAEPTFDHADGFYTGPFSLKITTTTPGAQIRYTLDGTAPSATNGTLYTGPISITGESNVRAITYATGYLPSTVNTASYIYTAQVLTQSANGATPAGWPSSWGSSAPVHYGMDPTVVNNPLYSSEIQQDLLTIPTFSLTMNLNDLFDPSTGIYSNPSQTGSAWERSASIELINPNGTPGFQSTVGVSIHGGASTISADPKHGFRIKFDGKFGPSELDYPLFGSASSGAAQSFKEFDLRTDQNNSWQYDNPSQFIGFRDEFASQTLAAMGKAAEHTQICFLYINGVFWGLYATMERPDANFAASYFGGSSSQYDVIKSGGFENGWTAEATNGTMDSWNQLYTDLTTQDLSNNANYEKLLGNNPDGTPNASYPKMIDADDLIDYILTTDYTGNLDAPNSQFVNNNPNNFYAIRPQDGSFGFRFVATDSEWTLLDPNTDRVNSDNTGKSNVTANPEFFFQQLEANANFKQLVADHIEKDFYNGGPLSVAGATARFTTLENQAYGPVVLESARWGDTMRPGDAYTRDNEWQTEVNRLLTTYLPYRTNTVINQLAAVGLFPNVAAPLYSQYGGTIPSGFQLTISNPNGTGTNDPSNGIIYYTLDGSDPRLPDGSLSSKALAYTGPITLSTTTEVKSRVLQNGTWSAAQDSVFAAQASSVRVTELDYDPSKPPKLLNGVTDPYNNDDFEFIELKNFGTTAVNLNDMSFTDGITFTFGNVSLAPGQVGVLVNNEDAFKTRYGNNINIIGSYLPSATNFSNSGEHVELVDAAGDALADFTYSATWYPTTKGNGATLEVINPIDNTDLNLASAWRASTITDGTPGIDETTPTSAPTGLVATPGAGKVVLTWAAVPGAISYNVYAGTGTGQENATPIATVTTPTYTDISATSGTHYYEVTAVDPGGESGRSGEAIATIATPPHVTGVFVRGSSWTTSFLNNLVTQGLGSATYGFAIAAGAKQTASLPWNNINRISVQFDQAVTSASLQQATAALHGVNVANYTLSSPTLSSDGKTVTWSLSQSIAADKLQLHLSGLTNASGVAMDGAWTNGASSFPSGNGTAGSAFAFTFDVLPGDVDRNAYVLITDYNLARAAVNIGAGTTGYNLFADINGDGFDLIAHSNAIRALVNLEQLPQGMPT